VTFSEVTRWSRQRLLTRVVAPLFVFYTGPDRRFVQEVTDQSIKRGSSVKELVTGATQPTARMAAMGGKPTFAPDCARAKLLFLRRPQPRRKIPGEDAKSDEILTL
jgi:hypothetical protein